MPADTMPLAWRFANGSTRRFNHGAQRLFEWCASLQMAVGIAVSLIISLAFGAWLESRAGAAGARVHVYQTPWFFSLLTLLAINVMAAAVIRYPWKPRQAGFVITHIGIEMLLAGALIGARSGLDAQVRLGEGASTSTVELDRDRLLVSEPEADGTPIGFEIPLDLWSKCSLMGRWPAGQSIPLHGAGEARMTVINWLPSARIDPNNAGAYVEAPVSPTDLAHSPRALQVAIEFAGQRMQIWLTQGATTSIDTLRGPLRLAYAPAEKSLPFTLAVTQLRRIESRPGEPIGYDTDVIFMDATGSSSRQTVRVNEPASFGDYAVYPGTVDEHDPAAPAAVLDIRSDPGRLLKYAGAALIVAGTCSLFAVGVAGRRVSRASVSGVALVCNDRKDAIFKPPAVSAVEQDLQVRVASVLSDPDLKVRLENTS